MGKKTRETIDKLLFPKRRATIVSKHDSGGEDIFIPSKVTEGRTLEVTFLFIFYFFIIYKIEFLL